MKVFYIHLLLFISYFLYYICLFHIIFLSNVANWADIYTLVRYIDTHNDGMIRFADFHAALLDPGADDVVSLCLIYFYYYVLYLCAHVFRFYYLVLLSFNFTRYPLP